MHHPTNRIAHTTAFVTPVGEHWLEREIAQWVNPMKDRSDDPSHHERTLLPRSYISLQVKTKVKTFHTLGQVKKTHIRFTGEVLNEGIYSVCIYCVGVGNFYHASSRELFKHACLGHILWLRQRVLPKTGRGRGKRGAESYGFWNII